MNLTSPLFSLAKVISDKALGIFNIILNMSKKTRESEMFIINMPTSQTQKATKCAYLDHQKKWIRKVRLM